MINPAAFVIRTVVTLANFSTSVEASLLSSSHLSVF
jgi:hypothetical protein